MSPSSSSNAGRLPLRNPARLPLQSDTAAPSVASAGSRVRLLIAPGHLLLTLAALAIGCAALAPSVGISAAVVVFAGLTLAAGLVAFDFELNPLGWPERTDRALYDVVEAPSPANPLVMIVEDQPELRHLSRIRLELSGFRTVEACSGEEALERLTDEIDIVLLDLGLPQMSGLDCLAEISARGARAKVIVMSGLDMDIVREEAMDLGATDFIAKPARGEVLVGAVHHAVR